MQRLNPNVDNNRNNLIHPQIISSTQMVIRMLDAQQPKLASVKLTSDVISNQPSESYKVTSALQPKRPSLLNPTSDERLSPSPDSMKIKECDSRSLRIRF